MTVHNSGSLGMREIADMNTAAAGKREGQEKKRGTPGMGLDWVRAKRERERGASEGRRRAPGDEVGLCNRK